MFCENYVYFDEKRNIFLTFEKNNEFTDIL